jgi:hypothetical protein
MMPDLFDGNPITLNRPADFDIMKWLGGEYHPNKRAHDPPHVDPIIDSCIIELRQKHGIKVSRHDGSCNRAASYTNMCSRNLVL